MNRSNGILVKYGRVWMATIGVYGMVVFAAPAFAQSSSEGGRPSITVEFDNELVTLAKGYEQAFRKLPAGPKFVVIKSDEGPVHLMDSIRDIEAAGGVVIIRMQKGIVYALNAGDIIKLTNENPNNKR